MNKTIFLIFVFILLAIAPVLADVCSFKSECDAGETGILSIYSLTNSHISYYGHSETNFDLCCQGITSTISDGCSDTYLISMSGTASTQPSNQHAGNSIEYENDVCLSNVNNCYFSSDCGVDECVLSLSDTADAHVGDCSAYDNNVCCVFDTSFPILEITSPENMSYGSSEVLISFSSDKSTDILSYSNDNAAPVLYAAQTSVTLADGFHNFSFFAKNLANNEISENVFFLVDTIDPVFGSPYYSASSREITFAVSDENLDSCWYVNSGNVVLVNCNQPFVFSGLEGVNEVVIWANDTAGHVANKQFILTQDMFSPEFTSIDNFTLLVEKKLRE